MDIDIAVAILLGFVIGAYFMTFIMAICVANNKQDVIKEFHVQNFPQEKRNKV